MDKQPEPRYEHNFASFKNTGQEVPWAPPIRPVVESHMSQYDMNQPIPYDSEKVKELQIVHQLERSRKQLYLRFHQITTKMAKMHIRPESAIFMNLMISEYVSNN